LAKDLEEWRVVCDKGLATFEQQHIDVAEAKRMRRHQQPGPDLRQARPRASPCDAIMFSQPWYALFVKNTLPFMMTQQVNSPEYTDVNRFSYIYTELPALALRSFFG